MLMFRDFVPKMTIVRPAGFFSKQVEEFETFEQAVVAAGEFIRDTKVRVRQIETVVLPNLWKPEESGTTDPAFVVHEQEWGGDNVFSRWHQFVRVWYELDPPAQPYR